MPIEDVIAKLKRLEAMGSCPACGNASWEPQAQFVWLPVVVLEPRQAAGPDLTHGIPCVALLCTHCGYVALHATELVKNR